MSAHYHIIITINQIYYKIIYENKLFNVCFVSFLHSSGPFQPHFKSYDFNSDNIIGNLSRNTLT